MGTAYADDNTVQQAQQTAEQANQKLTQKELEEHNKAVMAASNIQEWLRKNLPIGEGNMPEIYLDPKGVPTIGVGHALGEVESKNGVKSIEIYDIDVVNDRLEKARLPPISEQDWAVVQASVDAWRAVGTNVSEEQRAEMNSALKQNTRYRLDEKQALTLMERDIEERSMATARNAAKVGIDLREHPLGVRRALADATFRGGLKLVLQEGHQNTEALKKKDYGRFMFEIGLRSNNEGLPGNDVRNTKLVEEIYQSLSPEQQAEAMQNYHEALRGNPAQTQKVRQRMQERKLDIPFPPTSMMPLPTEQKPAEEPTSFKLNQGLNPATPTPLLGGLEKVYPNDPNVMKTQPTAPTPPAAPKNALAFKPQQTKQFNQPQPAA